MNGSVVTLVHAVLPALAPMQEALARVLPQTRVRHLLDEGLSSEAERRGGVDRVCVERMLDVLELADRAKTDAILLTCTAYTTMVPEARERFPGTPIFAVDHVMVQSAVANATTIGVLATFPAGLTEQTKLLEREAAAQNKEIVIVPSLHPAAMQALRAGNASEHDEIVLDALPDLLERSEIVLLAQASMARVVEQIPQSRRDRVLSSPYLAAKALKQHFERTR